MKSRFLAILLCITPFVSACHASTTTSTPTPTPRNLKSKPWVAKYHHHNKKRPKPTPSPSPTTAPTATPLPLTPTPSPTGTPFPSPTVTPTPVQSPTPFPSAYTTEVYATADDGTPLHCLVFPPAGKAKAPAIFVFHIGGFWSGDAGPLGVCSDLQKAGYWALAAEYRLAPPGKLVGQKSAGHYPDQTNDVKLLVVAARKDPRFNGKVYVVGGSAGGSHAYSAAAIVDKVAALSPPTDFTASPQDAHFNNNVTNYVGSTDAVELLAASPVSIASSAVAQVLIIASAGDSMPPEQYARGVEALTNAGHPPQALLISGSQHAFDYWGSVKSQVLAFLADSGPTPTPSASPTLTPTPTSTPSPSPSPTSSPTLTPSPTPAPNPRNLKLGIMALLKSIAIDTPFDISKDGNWTNPLVQGIAYRTQWNKVEPKDGQFDFSNLDLAFSLAAKNGKKISIVVIAGVARPDWYAALPDAKLIIIHADSGTETMPLTWDPLFQARWSKLLKALGDRFGSNPQLAYVTMSGAGRRAESYFVTTPEDQAALEAIGGLPKWREGAEWVIDEYMRDFPADVPMVLDLGPPAPTNEGQAALAALCAASEQKHGKRFGVKSDGLSANYGGGQFGAQEVQKLSLTCLVGFQMTLPDKGKGELGTALDNGLALGAHFIEVYANDCTDPVQAQVLKDAYPKFK